MHPCTQTPSLITFKQPNTTSFYGKNTNYYPPLLNKSHILNEHSHSPRKPSCKHNQPMDILMPLHQNFLLTPCQTLTSHPCHHHHISSKKTHTTPPKICAYNSLISHYAKIMIPPPTSNKKITSFWWIH